MNFVGILDTDYGQMLVHKFDTVQTPYLREHKKSISHREIEILRPYIHKDTVFLDIGANIGCFSLAYASVAKKVMALEAQMMFGCMLAGSVALNGLLNVVPCHQAVSNKSEFIRVPQFDITKELSWGSVEFGKDQREKLSQERLPDVPEDYQSAYPLDILVSKADKYVIKIDVEGMELKILEGAENLVRMARPVLFVEHYKAVKEDLRDWFDAHDYTYEDVGVDYLGLPNVKSSSSVSVQ